MGWFGVGIVVALLIALGVAVVRRQRQGPGDGNRYDPIQNRDNVEAMRNPILSGDQRWARRGGQVSDRNGPPRDV